MSELLPVVKASLISIAGPPLFLACFALIVWWVCRGDRCPVYRRAAQLPLEEDESAAVIGGAE